MHKILITTLLIAFSLNANALSILLAGGNNSGGEARDVTARLTSLGHTVTNQNAAWWGGSWDYSSYDVVAFQYGTNNVGIPWNTTEYNSTNDAGIKNLLSAVENNEVGVVFFRGYGAGLTADALGLTEAGVGIPCQNAPCGEQFPWQYAQNNLDIVDTSHAITQGMNLGINDLGYTYMSHLTNPGANTTVLANGADGAALVVHNSLRIVSTPFYGYTCTQEGCIDEFAAETALGIQLTENSLQWAAGMSLTPVPVPAAVWLFGSALAGLGWIRRKPAV